MYYLYHNGSNFDAVKSAISDQFSNFDCIVSDSLIVGLKEFSRFSKLYTYSDIYLKYYAFDVRINCHVYLLTVCRAGRTDYIKLYGSPQAVGFCAIDTTEV